jgi:hypothetical protein
MFSVVLLITKMLRKLSKFSQKSSCQALLLTSKRCHSPSKRFKLPSWIYGATPISPSWRTTQPLSETSAKHQKYQPKLSQLLPASVGQTNQFPNRPRQAQLRIMKLRPQRQPPETIWKYCWTPSLWYETSTRTEFTFKFEKIIAIFSPYKAPL